MCIYINIINFISHLDSFVLSHFSKVDDSSIECSGNTKSVEFVYNGTFTIDDLEDEDIVNDFKKIGNLMEECDNESCGTHIHMSCPINPSIKDKFVVHLQKAWLILQDYFIDNWYGEERVESIYCQPNTSVLHPDQYEKYLLLNLFPSYSDINEVHVEYRGLPYVDWWKNGTNQLKTYLNDLHRVWCRASFACGYHS